MRISLFLTLLLAGCASPVGSDLSAEGELMLTAISAEEEGLRDGVDDFYGDPERAGTDVDQPRIGRDCDSSAIADSLFAQYDRDADSQLDSDEESEVWQARSERGQRHWRHRAMRWQLLELVYDADADGELGKLERGELLADFTTRCEVRQEELLAEYDADGDGELSDEELELVRAELEEQREERGEMCNGGGGDRPEGAERGERPEGASLRGMGRERPDVSEVVTQAWDEDGDGSLSVGEREAMTSTIRERITTGERISPLQRG